MTSGKQWQLCLIALVAVFAVAMVATLIAAKRKVSRVVDPQYYSHGLQYAGDRDKARNPGVDWQMTTLFSGGYLELAVRDSSGVPVARGGATLFVEPDAAGVGGAELPFREVAAGVYRLTQPVAGNHPLKGSIRFTMGEGHVVGKVLVLN